MNSLSPSDPADRHLLRRQIATVATVYLGYALIMVQRMIPSVAGNAMRNDLALGIDLATLGRIFSVGTIGAIVGKLICGYAADKFGGKRTLALGLTVAALAISVFGFSSQVWQFQASYFVALMAIAAGWPSMARIIKNWFHPDQYGRVWGILSTSSRVGTLSATFGFGSLLAWMSWRGMLWLAAGMGVLAAVIFLFLLQERPPTVPAVETNAKEQSPPSSARLHPLDGMTVFNSIPHFLSSLQFWLITWSLMGLGILWDFLLMVPPYLQDTLALTSADASRAASAFPLGSLISVLAGGYVFDKLPRRATASLMGLLLTIATLCLVTMFWMPRLALGESGSFWLSIGLLFVFGLCVSPCYYIPMSVFSIEFGGPHSGFLVALLDAESFAAAAVFYYFGGGWAKQSWSLFLSILVTISAWSAITTYLFMRGESTRQRLSIAA